MKTSLLLLLITIALLVLSVQYPEPGADAVVVGSKIEKATVWVNQYPNAFGEFRAQIAASKLTNGEFAQMKVRAEKMEEGRDELATKESADRFRDKGYIGSLIAFAILHPLNVGWYGVMGFGILFSLRYGADVLSGRR